MTEYRQSETVYIALATDARYIAPTMITVRSIALCSNKDRHYEIVILSEKKLSMISRSCLKSTVKEYPNIRIVFLDVGEKTKGLKLAVNGPVKGVTKTTYLRFLLPDLLGNIQKIIYMDVDTAVLGDIAQLFDFSLNGAWIGGVRDIAGSEDKAKRCAELGIPDIDHYINAGVLLIDLEQFRKENLSDAMMNAAAEKTYAYNDQDIINMICYGKICFLPYACNAIVDYLNHPEMISEVLNIDYLKETENPLILHYAGKTKPWYDPKGRWSFYWWKTAETLTPAAKLIFRIYMHSLTS